MQLTDLNPARDIGANCLLVELGPFRFVVDCGLHPKKTGHAATPSLGLLGDQPLDFIIITHAHLDHGGSLPVLLRRDAEAPVLITPPTQTLLPRMLRNSCSVMLRQRDELRIPEYPLFTFGEIERLERRLWPLPFNRTKVFEKHGQRLELTFFPAGHVAGATAVRLVCGAERVFFTGDVLFREQLTLAGAEFPQETFDTVVTETTRGATQRHAAANRLDEAARLVEALEQTLAGGGAALVPVFALGRMQEIFALLRQARRQRQLRRVPIYASGLGLDLVDYYDAISQKNPRVRFRRAVLQELGVQPLRQDLVPGREPSQKGLFIVSSGMMLENTPSYAVAATLLAQPRNGVFFVGYCDPDTPGGKLQATARGAPFRFEALRYATPVQARVERFDLSGHADREELADYARACQPKTIVLTHGDPPAREWFRQELTQGAQAPRVVDLTPGEPCEM